MATGKGSEIRYWVWNVASGVGKQAAVRQAAAQIFDREAIAKDAYDNTVDPLYSIVPPGYGGQKDSYKDGVRRARRGQGQADPAGGRHQHAGPDHRRLDAHPLRPQRRGRGQRGPAPAERRAGCSR